MDRVMTLTEILATKVARLLTVLMILGITPLGTMASAESEQENQQSIGDRIDAATERAMSASQKAFYEAINKMAVSVSFKKGYSVLGKSDRRSLRALVEAHKSQNTRAYIAAWGDQSLREDAPDKEQDSSSGLAQKRMDAIQTQLKKTGFGGRVVLVNMAAKPSAVAEALGFESEEVKSATLTSSDQTTVAHQKIADVLESKGGLGKAVIVLVETK